MKKTFIAAMMLACFSLSASANTVQGPTDPEFEAWVYMQVAAGEITAEEADAMIVNHMNGDYGIDTYAIASPNSKKGNRNPDLREEEVPFSISPVVTSKKNKKNK